MEKSKERLQVVENIKNAIKNQQLNSKVEESDHIVTTKERKNTILKFDNLRRNPIKKLNSVFARNVVNGYTKSINSDTKIIGIKNIQSVKTGAIITCNHFCKEDSTVIRCFVNKIGKKNHFDIIIEECNVFMQGHLGWLMNNCMTLPLSTSTEYMNKNLIPAMRTLLKRKDFILIYPENEMWFNYKKPRPCKIGAYHFATEFNVPVIPCFIEIHEKDEFDVDGFNKLQFTLHIMPPIYPDSNKNLNTNKKEMQEKDYKLKVEKYEEVYHKKLTYEFNNEDIAGY